jgi:hypothetical protein
MLGMDALTRLPVDILAHLDQLSLCAGGGLFYAKGSEGL